MLPTADRDTQIEVFNANKTFQLSLLEKIHSMVKQGALKKGPHVVLNEKGIEDDNNDKDESECEEPYEMAPPKKCKKKTKGNHMAELKMSMDMDRVHVIETFEEIGMTDPFRTKNSIKVAKRRVAKLNFEKEVYPNSIATTIMEAALKDGGI